MNRTHAFLSFAAALSLAALVQPTSQWVGRLRQVEVPPTPHAITTGGTLRLEGALSHRRPLEGGATYVRYDVRASQSPSERPSSAVQLALVLDRSGSMAGEKLLRTKAAALSLVELLGEDDELAVVSFGSDVTHTELIRTTSEGKAQLREAINALNDSGGTNISQAMLVAEQVLSGSTRYTAVRRVVLVSDGQPTEGITAEGSLVNLAVTLHEHRMAVAALGVGTDFNSHLMERLAERGGGYYAYLNDPSRLTEVLKLELAQARGAVARNVVLDLTLSSGVELVQVAGRDVVRSGQQVQVPLQDFTRGQTAQAFIELKLPAGSTALTVDAQLEYLDAESGALIHSQLARLAANSTDNAALSEESKDSQVALECLRAVGSTQVVQAAAAFQRGDRASAFAFLDNARGLFAMSADSLAGADLEDTANRWKNTTDPDAARHEGMMVEKKKMVDFGKNNSY